MDPEPLKKLDIYAVMKKKDEIEGEIRESHGVLQTVSRKRIVLCEHVSNSGHSTGLIV